MSLRKTQESPLNYKRPYFKNLFFFRTLFKIYIPLSKYYLNLYLKILLKS